MQRQAIDHWKALSLRLKDVVSRSSTDLFDYLRVDIEAIETFPPMVAALIADIRNKGVPTDLTKASCVYMVAILKLGSRPNEHTGSIHQSQSEVESIGVKESALPKHALFALDEQDARRAPASRTTGDVMYPDEGLVNRYEHDGHIGVVLSNQALSDPNFVESLLILSGPGREPSSPYFYRPNACRTLLGYSRHSWTVSKSV